MGEQIIKRITRAVRAADEKFKRVGGSSRHWVIECLMPCLETEGLMICSRETHTEINTRIAALEAELAAWREAARWATTEYSGVGHREDKPGGLPAAMVALMDLLDIG